MRKGLRSSAVAGSPENVVVLEKDNVDSDTSKGDEIASESENVKNAPEFEPTEPPKQGDFPCPRCNSTDTKFLFYNNRTISQPRHFCNSCLRSWTQGGTLRILNLPIGRKTTRPAYVERGVGANVSSTDGHAITSGRQNELGPKGRERKRLDGSDDEEKYLGLGKKRPRGPLCGKHPREPDNAPCPRCDSTNTKFVAYNNYKVSQPRYLCNSCLKTWTRGGTVRKQLPKKKRVKVSDKKKGIANSALEKGVESNNADGSKKVAQVADSIDPECIEDSAREREMEGKRNMAEESEQMECNQDADSYAHGDNHTGNPDANAVTSGLETRRGRQGMGRRRVDNSVDNLKDSKIRKNQRRGPSRSKHPREPDHAPCPRCNSTNTKFMTYCNYKLSQPRYMCNSCHKSWTRGGIIREHMGKKRRVESSDKEKGIVDSGLEKGYETNSTDCNEMVAQVANLTDRECVEDSLEDRKMEGKRNGSEKYEQIEDNEEADGSDADGDNHTGKRKVGRGLKGRKRKCVGSSVLLGDDDTLVKKSKEVSRGGMARVVGRILRSRTLVMNGTEKTVDVGLLQGVLGSTGKKEIDVSTENITEIENCDTAQLIDRRKKKIKGKIRGKSGPLKAISSEKQKEMGFSENGDQLKSKKAARVSKFLPSGKRNRLASKLRCSGQKIIVEQSKTSKQKEGGDRKRSTEKRLLRDRIIAMLKSAGWTIEYKPRSGREFGREYFDAVYVSPKGRGLWSVTLAYEILRKQVESGDADSRALAAFTPIPEEELSILFRITKKKMGLPTGLKRQREGANKKHEGITQTKKFKKKYAKRGTKHKSSDGEQDVPANTLHRGMQRSHRRKRLNGKRSHALVVRHSTNGLDPDSEGLLLYDGKRSLLTWMIDLGTVPLSGKVQYMNHSKTRALLEGRITRDGIHCDCCNETLALSEFESHAGTKESQTFQNIFLESGSSLLQCLVDSWNKHDGSDCAGIHSVDTDGGDPNDDTCNKCGDGGDLICCDGCPSTFHQSCLNIQKFPSGDWHCVYCSCKFCGMVGGNKCPNRDATGSALLTCRLCEEKYHLLCIQVNGAVHVNSDCPSFCGEKCQEVFERLQVLLGVKNQLEEGYSWTLSQCCDVSSHTSLGSCASKVESNSKLAVAFSILDECFLPIVDPRSGINVIRNVVYSCGSNFTRLNYTGFFTATLERGDEIISAASIRVHGNHLAEMPFIGTRHIYRRQGMCRRLLNAVELALRSLNVEKLVIPAIAEMLQTWTSVFGFTPLEESNKKEMEHMNMVVFPGVDMLEKPILRQKSGGESLISTADPTEHKTEHQTSHAHRSSNIAAAECDASDVTSEAVNFQDSITVGKCLVHSGVTHDNQECENKQVKDSEASCGDALELDGHCTEGETDKQINAHMLSYVSQIASDATKCEESLDGKCKEGADHELNREVKDVHIFADIMTEPQDATLSHLKQDVAQIHEQEIVALVHNKEGADHELNGEVKTVNVSAEIMTEPQDATPSHLKQDVAQIHEPEIVASVHYKEGSDHELNGEVKDVHPSTEIMTERQDATLSHPKQEVAQIHESEIIVVGHNNCFPFDDTTNPNSEVSHNSNGLCKPSECQSGIGENDTCPVYTAESLNRAVGAGQTSCLVIGMDIHEMKEDFTAGHTDSCSLDVDSLPNRPQISANCSKESESGSQVDSHRLWESGKLC